MKDRSSKDITKKKKIAKHFLAIMKILQLDVENESLKKTPSRVAKMYVDEIFSGLKKENFPSITTQRNNFSYREPVIIKDIKIATMCEHHFLPFFGTAKISYIPKDKIIGLSKINRIVKYYCQKPQLQERLTLEITYKLKQILETEDVAVSLKATHFCMRMRGVEDENSTVVTNEFSGIFKKNFQYRGEFLNN